VEDNSPAKAGLVRSNSLGLYKREQNIQNKDTKINPKTETKNQENHRKETKHK